MWITVKIRAHERGLHFKDEELVGVLGAGKHTLWGTGHEVDVRSTREWLTHDNLAPWLERGVLGDEVRVIDLKDDDRALVWIGGRFNRLLGPGLHALWNALPDVRVDAVTTAEPGFEHAHLATIFRSPNVGTLLYRVDVAANHVALLFLDGKLHATLEPGLHAFWLSAGVYRALHVDRRRVVLDVSGQEIMTADKVTLRLNAVVSYRVTDPEKAVTAVDDYAQALYRDAQLALRAVVGGRELDALLSDKDAVAEELLAGVRTRAEAYGITVDDLGIRDVILPGDMRQLLNSVTEAKKAAEAALITRREETAATRAHANTAKILESNPILLRLRELETLERVADKANLTVLLGDKGLTESVVKML